MEPFTLAELGTHLFNKFFVGSAGDIADEGEGGLGGAHGLGRWVLVQAGPVQEEVADLERNNSGF